ncbi:hypothetical protein IW261DRAFT_1427524 [Armillaria novae-zelandiae]|uniref:Uncharacterized protein n=1 Tax=Armillaria novae-zelandiae TaxID=153914 RepID=A0AA39TRG9_9AGAR|nr:hypothetical protein IW261DRAFT_1427524 [Armillaria novae-zelandiae]
MHLAHLQKFSYQSQSEEIEPSLFSTLARLLNGNLMWSNLQRANISIDLADVVRLDSVLCGSEVMEISHESVFLEPMTDAYLEWLAEQNEDKEPSSMDNVLCNNDTSISVLNIFNWQLANCCAACTFKLEGEEQLEFSMFRAMDSNDLLKHILHSKTVDEMENKKVCIEQADSCDGGSGYILPRSEVDHWSKDAISDVEVVNKETASPCEEHWKNMLDDHTSKMWGVFEETRFFLSLCCHGSVLIGADMVRSGEQAKYPLAIVERLLKVFGLGLEDLKTLEHFFSKSNALAARDRYTSSFLCNNYQQALEIIESYPALKKSMHELGVTDKTEFESWLREEEVYLLCLQKELPEETLEMEYFAQLVHYYDIE